MQFNKIAGLLVTAGIGYWIYSKYQFGQNLTFLINKIGIGGSFFDPAINIDILVNNASNINTTISNINGELFLQSGLKIADVYFDQKIVIKAKNKTILPLKAVTKIEDAIKILQSSIKNKNFDFKFNGIATVDSIMVPFEIKYNFND